MCPLPKLSTHTPPCTYVSRHVYIERERGRERERKRERERERQRDRERERREGDKERRGRERRESMYVCMYLCVRESRERVEKEKNLKIILTEVRDNRGLVN